MKRGIDANFLGISLLLCLAVVLIGCQGTSEPVTQESEPITPSSLTPTVPTTEPETPATVDMPTAPRSFNADLTWAPVAGATSYQVIVATDPELTNTVAGTPVSINATTYRAVSLYPGTTYFWAVRMIAPSIRTQSIATFTTPGDPPAAATPSTTLSVETEPSPEIPSTTPVIISPSNWQTFSLDPVTGRGVPVQLSWTQVTGEQDHLTEWQISLESLETTEVTMLSYTAANPDMPPSVLSSSLDGWPTLLPATSYRIKVRGVRQMDGVDEYTPWSAPVSFRVGGGGPVFSGVQLYPAVIKEAEPD